MKNRFYAKTNEGYIVKILAELLQNIIKTACIHITPSGITLRMMDSRACILVDMELFSDKFHKFELKENINIGINLIHFYKMLKSVKKKDDVVLYMNDDQSEFLHIEIHPKDNDGMSSSSIHVHYLQSVDIPLPSGYQNPVIVSSNKYQRTIKEMNTIGDGMIKVNMKKYSVQFSCMSNQIYTKKVFFGDKVDDTEEIVSTLFNSELFTRTIKLAGLNKDIYVYGNQELPFLLKTNVGNLGTISVFIKSNKQIEESS